MVSVNILNLRKMVMRKDWSEDVPRTNRTNIKHGSYSPGFRAFAAPRFLWAWSYLPPRPCHLQDTWPWLHLAPSSAGSSPWQICNAPSTTITILRYPLQLGVQFHCLRHRLKRTTPHGLCLCYIEPARTFLLKPWWKPQWPHHWCHLHA